VLELLEGILTGTCTEKARAYDQQVAREYDEKNRRDVKNHQQRNNAITGGIGLAVLGAVAAYGMNKLGGNNTKKN